MNSYIAPSDKIEVKNTFRPDEMLISLGDVAFAGAILGYKSSSPEHFAACIASLSHIITRIVLSERLVFFYGQEENETGPTEILVPQLKRFCNTLIIDEDHPAAVDIKKLAFSSPEQIFDEHLITNMTSDCASFAPWFSDKSLANAWLAEFALSEGIGVPFAPNPFVSNSIGLFAIIGKSSAENLISYLEDLRRETATEVNALRQLNVYDLQLPAIFGAVLRESNSPGDLIRVAGQMNAEAKAFRGWCCHLEDLEKENPKGYTERIKSAHDSLERLESSLDAKKGERMQISPPGPFNFVKLRSATLRNVVNWLDVDIGFIRPRHFLLNLLSSARQARSLKDEIVRVFGIRPEFAEKAVDHYYSIATKDHKTDFPRLF